MARLVLFSSTFFILIGVLCSCQATNVQLFISSANIYYQRPLLLGAPQELPLQKVEELPSNQDIKVIIHGYLGSREHSSITPLGNAYMAKGTDHVLLADWADAASVDYPNSRRAVFKVGIHLAKILDDFLIQHQIDRSTVHILGHSLGAHIAGNMGRYFNGTLGRVTGLDPALPLFQPHSFDSLHPNAARYVDVVHTDYPVFGDITPRGIVDFYPNFGFTPQPGCDDLDLLSASKLLLEAYSCSHNRAVVLYAESIGLPKSFPAIPCSLMGIKLRSVPACRRKIMELRINETELIEAIVNMDETHVVYMGEEVNKGVTGPYYLSTYDAPPFGMGVNTKYVN